MPIERIHRSEIPAWDCFQLLEQQRVGRLTIIENGYPVAIPVSYRMAGEHTDRRVVVRTSPDTTIGRYEGPASIEVDHIDEQARRGRRGASSPAASSTNCSARTPCRTHNRG
jgi:nitroimidazol reductase NimA-like FMN-containing flavoprotein (pyridoxamine 5'-phosphate oxidase superfamily)